MFGPLSALKRRRRLVALLLICLVASGLSLSNETASSLPIVSVTGVSAIITPPSCGRVVTVDLKNSTANLVQFWLRRPVPEHSFAWVNVPANSSTTVTRLMDNIPGEDWGVIVSGKLIAEKQVVGSATCYNGQWIPTGTGSPINILISPGCSNQANVTIGNWTGSTVQFDIMRAGTALPVSSVYQGTRVTSTVTVPVTNAVADVFTVLQGSTVMATLRVPRSAPCAPLSKVDWGPPVASDEFNGASLDTNKWYVYNNPLANYPRVPQAVAEKNNELQITGQIYPNINGAPHDESGGVGMRFGQKFGRWEVRFRADKGQGYAPVITLWPDSEKWPGDGEIDVIEIPFGDSYDDSTWFHDGGGNNAVHNKTATNINYDFTQWAVMIVDWQPNRLSVRLNGVERFVTTDPKYIPTTSSMHMTLQNDVTAIPWGIPRLPTTPAQVTMHVDYVRAYKPAA